MFHIIYPNTEKGKSGSIGFYDVDNLKFVENTEESIMEISNVCYYDAKITELDNWKQHNVYCEVPYHWQHLIPLRWVCSIKETNTSFVPKAQLAAKGFEDNDKNNVSKESPTCLK